jgi:hypothetical protein
MINTTLILNWYGIYIEAIYVATSKASDTVFDNIIARPLMSSRAANIPARNSKIRAGGKIYEIQK